MFETNSEYTRIVGAIRAQCSRNENPPELTDPPKAAAILDLQRVKSHFNSRKISLTCQSVKTPIGDTKVDPLLLDPHNKNAQNRRLRSPLPSPLPSPASSPLPSPSRSRFQVSKILQHLMNSLKIENFRSHAFLSRNHSSLRPQAPRHHLQAPAAVQHFSLATQEDFV